MLLLISNFPPSSMSTCPTAKSIFHNLYYRKGLPLCCTCTVDYSMVFVSHQHFPSAKDGSSGFAAIVHVVPFA